MGTVQREQTKRLPVMWLAVALALITEMDQSTLVRYLGELIWFPRAWLSDAITWQALDASLVKATIHERGVRALLWVNEQGQPILFRADRYQEERGHYPLTPRSVLSNTYWQVERVHIPTHFEVTWHLPDEDFTWLRGDLTRSHTTTQAR